MGFFLIFDAQGLGCIEDEVKLLEGWRVNDRKSGWLEFVLQAMKCRGFVVVCSVQGRYMICCFVSVDGEVDVLAIDGVAVWQWGKS